MNQDYNNVWNQCLTHIKPKIPVQSFDTWFKPIHAVSLTRDVLTIQVPSQYFYEWLEENYVNELQHAIDLCLGPNGKLEYAVVVDGGNSGGQPITLNLPNHHKKESESGKSLLKDRAYEFQLQRSEDDGLNPSYTFESFVEGDCNRLGRSAGLAVGRQPGKTSFNPFMIYGGVGLGKTHLVQAIGNEAKNLHPGLKVFYTSSEKFTNDFIDSLKNNNINTFTNFYMALDILIVDDIQFLAGKEKTQDIFFHIFNHIHQSGKQVILTSDVPPRDLKGMHERLISRFKWGLTADLHQPDFETRIAIVQKKLQNDGIDIPFEVIEYLAYNVDSNIRELEGVLISMIAHSSLTRRDFDLTLAKQILQNIVHNIEKEVDIEFIQRSVSEFFNVTVELLKDKTRKKEIVIPRQLAMYFAKEYTDYSLKVIGSYFGGRDHTTVIHALQAVENMLATDKNFKTTFANLEKRLKLSAI